VCHTKKRCGKPSIAILKRTYLSRLQYYDVG
jgi:hypothetical protein